MTISPLPPLAIGFMGLGTGYYVWGGHEFFGIPQASEKVNKGHFLRTINFLVISFRVGAIAMNL
jgi:hypothetical protein